MTSGVKTLTIFIHGYNVRDGGTWSVGKLRPFFVDAGPYVMLNYGWIGLLGARRKNKKIAKRLDSAVRGAKLQGYKIVVVGHSNACSIIYLAAKYYNTPIDKAVFINPALKKNYAPGKSIKAVDVWHSPSDTPVKLATWLLPSSNRPWGEMGADGYQGEDIRIMNYNKEENYPISSKKHSDVFKAEKLTYFGPLIAEKALAE